MIFTKKFLLTAAAGALMFTPALSSQAVTFTLTVPSATAISPAQNNFVQTGVSSDNNIFNAALLPSIPVTLNNQSNVSYGTTQIGGGFFGASDTFSTMPANFTFDVTANNITNVFVVNGEIDNGVGTTNLDANGNGSTNASFKVDSLVLNGVTTFTNLVSSPNAGRTSLVASNVSFGDTFANVYIEQINGLTAPFSFTSLSVGGYIGVTAVPEPGGVALLMGLGVSSAGFLARRRRAQRVTLQA